MGAEQVLRGPRRGALSALAIAAAIGAPAGAHAGEPEPVIIVDLRPGSAAERGESRDAFARELGGVQGIELVDDAELTAALTGAIADDVQPRAAAALERASSAYGSLDCTASVAAAADAVGLFAELQARGDAVVAELTQAYVYALLCAHSAGDSEAAAAAANRLHRLGVAAPPTGVSQAIWDAYPVLDARANVAIVELTVTSEPTGATVWVDHIAAGVTPATVLVPEGEHVVAVANDTGSTHLRTRASGTSAAATLALPEPATRWKAVAATVGAWRRGEAAATAVELGELMKITGVRFAVVLSGTRQVEVWAVRTSGDAARRHKSALLEDGWAVGVAITERVEQWDGRSPDPDLPLLVEDPNDAIPMETKKPLRWWVYATIIGSVLVGGLVVMANDLADDHQKIELTWP